MPGETLLASASERRLGGKGLNQAVTAARAGARVRFVARRRQRRRRPTRSRATWTRSRSKRPVPWHRRDRRIGGPGRTPTARTRSSAPPGRRTRCPLQSVEGAIATPHPAAFCCCRETCPPTSRAMRLSRAGPDSWCDSPTPRRWPFPGRTCSPDRRAGRQRGRGRSDRVHGASTVIVTEGASGATLIQDGQRRHVAAPPVDAASTPRVPATCFAACWPRPWIDGCRCWRRWSARCGRRRSR